MTIYGPATPRPGPFVKQGYGPDIMTNALGGVVNHSMVGYRDGALGRLDDLGEAASWHFSVLQSGEVLQHYPVEAITWHSGSLFWNQRLIGIEHEGGADPYDEPLTPAQRAASVALTRWLASTFGIGLVRRAGLYEHNEVSPVPTACPSGRIPWDQYMEATMTVEELRKAVGEIAAVQAGQIATLEKTQAFIGKMSALLSVGKDAEAEAALRYVYAIAHQPFPA